jgi:hypothetical protein
MIPPDPDYRLWEPQARKAWWDDFFRTAGTCEDDERENEAILDTVRHSEAVVWRDNNFLVPQPTWGFYVFLTDYDQVTRDSIPRAMDNWVRLIGWAQGANANNLYSDEAFRRFKLDLVDEQETLAEASIDRVRECFRALVRNLEITNDDGEDSWVPPIRNMVCLVLDADKVHMLANLTFPDDDTDFFEECKNYRDCQVQAVDIKWQRLEVTSSGYRGIKDISIDSLAHAYNVLDLGLDSYIE